MSTPPLVPLHLYTDAGAPVDSSHTSAHRNPPRTLFFTIATKLKEGRRVLAAHYDITSTVRNDSPPTGGASKYTLNKVLRLYWNRRVLCTFRFMFKVRGNFREGVKWEFTNSACNFCDGFTR